MAHRNDHEAALLRAESLARELAETKEALADKERVLAQREAEADASSNRDRVETLEVELAQAKQALAEKERFLAERESESKDTSSDSGRADLDKLRRQAARAAAEAKHEEERQRARDAANAARAERTEQRKTRVRLIRSASLAGGMFEWYTLLLTFPVFAMTTYAAALMALPMTWCFALAGGVVAAALFATFVYAPIRAMLLPRWVASLPYAVPHYVDLLSEKAPREDECMLVVTLEFAGAPPGDLATLVKGVDASLKAVGKNGFRRPFPISIHRSKHGTRWENHDTHLPLHRWFRNFERRALRPLHRLYPISSVKLERTTTQKRFPF